MENNNPGGIKFEIVEKIPIKDVARINNPQSSFEIILASKNEVIKEKMKNP